MSLSITGCRDDGYHDLLSVVWKTCWGDKLFVEALDAGQPDRLECDHAEVPIDASNLVLRALSELRRATGLKAGFAIRIEKRIPPGAGLGGGSSNAAALLRRLRAWYPDTVSDAAIRGVANRIGSDCLLFLVDGPCVMEGRGDVCDPLPDRVSRRLSGQTVWLVGPGLGVSTPRAYAEVVRRCAYTRASEARTQLDEWIRAGETGWPAAGNDFERVLPRWLPSYPLVLRALRARSGVDARLTGSGSSVIVRVPPGGEEHVRSVVARAWGEASFCVVTQLE